MPIAGRPENSRIPLILQWYKMVHFIMRIILCILEFVKKKLRHLVNTIHIFSVTLSPWIMNVFGLMKLLLDLKL